MKIVAAKPPFKYGIRTILTAKDLGIDVNPSVEAPQETTRSATTPEPEPEKAPEPVETVKNTAPEVVEEENNVQETFPEAETEEKVEENAEEAAPAATLKDLGLSSTARRVLKANGITTIEELKAFFGSGKTAQDLSGCAAKTRDAIQEEFSKLPNK